MAYGEAISIRRKHPMAVSTKPEASSGSKYKILRCLPIDHSRLPPISSASAPVTLAPISYNFAIRFYFNFALRRVTSPLKARLIGSGGSCSSKTSSYTGAKSSTSLNAPTLWFNRSDHQYLRILFKTIAAT
jgi:hypothetical protein